MWGRIGKLFSCQNIVLIGPAIVITLCICFIPMFLQGIPNVLLNNLCIGLLAYLT